MTEDHLKNPMAVEVSISILDLLKQERIRTAFKVSESSLDRAKEIVNGDWDEENYLENKAELMGLLLALESAFATVNEDEDE